jgi:hypothetical protein
MDLAEDQGICISCDFGEGFQCERSPHNF